eukprot:gene10773-11973_t
MTSVETLTRFLSLDKSQRGAGTGSNEGDKVISIHPEVLKYGVISTGFYYHLKFQIKNNTLSPVRVRVELQPSYGEKNSIRLVQLPDLVAPGMTTSITLELTPEFPGLAKFHLTVSQNHNNYSLKRDIDAHIVTQETFKYVKKSLQIQKRAVYQPNVEPVGPMLGLMSSSSTQTPITSLSEALIMDDEDMYDLLAIPMTPLTIYDPFDKCLRIDRLLGQVHVDPALTLEEVLAKNQENRTQRLEELEEQGFLTQESMDRLRKERESNGQVDPYDHPDSFGGFDSHDDSEREEEEGCSVDGEQDLAMTSQSLKTNASVSSLLAMKRDRIEQQRRATINASTAFAQGSKGVNALRTLTIVQNKSKTYSIAEEHKVA